VQSTTQRLGYETETAEKFADYFVAVLQNGGAGPPRRYSIRTVISERTTSAYLSGAMCPESSRSTPTQGERDLGLLFPSQYRLLRHLEASFIPAFRRLGSREMISKVCCEVTTRPAV